MLVIYHKEKFHFELRKLIENCDLTFFRISLIFLLSSRFTSSYFALSSFTAIASRSSSQVASEVGGGVGVIVISLGAPVTAVEVMLTYRKKGVIFGKHKIDTEQTVHKHRARSHVQETPVLLTPVLSFRLLLARCRRRGCKYNIIIRYQAYVESIVKLFKGYTV